MPRVKKSDVAETPKEKAPLDEGRKAKLELLLAKPEGERTEEDWEAIVKLQAA